MMKGQPLVSIIVPAYNLEDYIANCINSISNQIYRNLQIIIVDDGSSDNTVSVVNNLQKQDDRIYFISQKNGGAAKARNTGLKNAQGEYIMYVDGDDFLSPNVISDNIPYLEQNSDVDWVAFSILRVDKEGNRIYNLERQIYGDFKIREFEIIDSSKFVPYFAEKKLSGVCCGAIYRTSSIKDLSFSEGDYYEDGIYYIDILSYTSKGILSPNGYYGYVHRANSSQLHPIDGPHLLSDYKCFTKRLKQYPALYPDYTEIYYKWNLGYYYFLKVQSSKKIENAHLLFKTFSSSFRPRKKNHKLELKCLLYQFIGYERVKRIYSFLQSFKQ